MDYDFLRLLRSLDTQPMENLIKALERVQFHIRRINDILFEEYNREYIGARVLFPTTGRIATIEQLHINKHRLIDVSNKELSEEDLIVELLFEDNDSMHTTSLLNVLKYIEE